MSESDKKTFDDSIEIRGRMDIEDIVRLQINRCNASAYEPDQTMFNSSVNVLLDLLPQHKRNQVLSNELEYSKEIKVTKYRVYWCGSPMTDTKYTVKELEIDHHQLYRIVLDAYADSGLTWQIEPELRLHGRRKMKQQLKPTPKLEVVEND